MSQYTKLQLDIIRLKEHDKFTNIEIAEDLQCSYSYVCEILRMRREEGLSLLTNDDEGQLLLKAAKLTKTNQKLLDVQRVERKIREQIRNDNAVEELTKELIEIFRNRKPNRTIYHEIINNEAIGIFHITDPHFNELISIKGNTYDFHIAAKRLKKMVIESKKIFKLYNVKKVLFALTGDLLNSDRRLDELLNNSTNRSNACALGAIILEQTILDLNEDFNVIVASVAGNEGRVNDEMGSTEILMSDNYDVTMVTMLQLMFRNCKGIEFINESVVENVVNVNGHNILLIHGHQIKANHMTSMQKIRGKYSDLGIQIRFCLYGHLHATLITDFYGRGAGLAGSNSYSSNELQFSSNASENIHIITEKELHSIKLDLQNTDDIKGYNIDDDLIAYNAKSASKIKWMRPKKI